LLELVHSFNIKSDESILKSGFLENRYLVSAFVIGAFLQIGVVCIPALASIFNLVQLNIKCWLYVVAISVSPLFIIEIQKKLNEIKFGKVVYGYKNRMDY
jgi:Ca2+-transporting ATPase